MAILGSGPAGYSAAIPAGQHGLKTAILEKELISEAVAAMELEATVEDLMCTIHAHPTLSEAMLDASNSVYGMAINA